MPRAAAAGGGGSGTRASTRAAEAPLPPCPVLARFQAAWDELAPTLPAATRVRMEGVDPAGLSARRATALALRYPVKWATTTYACPPEARAPYGCCTGCCFRARPMCYAALHGMPATACSYSALRR
jgi:hypothetical protein